MLRPKFPFGSLWWKQIALIWRPFRSAENAASPHTRASWRKRSRLHAAFRCKKLPRSPPKPQKDFSDSTDEARYLQPRNLSRRGCHHRRIVRRARHSASCRHQRARTEISPSRSGEPDGRLSDLHIQVRSWRLAGQLLHSAWRTGDRKKNRRPRTTRDGL